MENAPRGHTGKDLQCFKPLSDYLCSFMADPQYKVQVSQEFSLRCVFDTSCISTFKLETKTNHNWQAVKGSKTLDGVPARQAKHGLLSFDRADVCETPFTARSGADRLHGNRRCVKGILLEYRDRARNTVQLPIWNCYRK